MADFALPPLEVKVDDLDWLLLGELQADARLSFSELSRRVHLSPPAVAERVRKLEESGVIAGYRAHVDPRHTGRSVVALVTMSCYGPGCVLRHPEVLDSADIFEVHRVTGGACCVLRVAVATMEDFESLIDRLAGYGTPSSSMVLSSPVPWRPTQP
ncbi:Lrp/AsnC family transcriptional regulator [Nonomuraea sp. NPDC059194]|uniref:Lrp/AsnC family transcriptional regulator n=1 Tax=Nonomuraea sp. NPDC059194 TaxID=3346764 RepID=UPI003674DE29